MGYTKSNARTAGTLTVDGASTLTGAVSAASTVSVTGVFTGSGTVTAQNAFTAGLSVSDYNTTYNMLVCDGVNPPTMQNIRLYDWGTGAWVTGTVTGGTLSFA